MIVSASGLLLLALAGAGSADTPSRAAALSISLRPSQARVGEWIEAEVVGRLPPGTKRVEPRLPGAVEGLEVLESGPLPAADGNLRWRLRLVAFDPGRRIVPPLVFRCSGEAAAEDIATSSLAVEILAPALPSGAELRASRAPAGLALTNGERLAVALGAIGVLLGARRLLRRRRSHAPESVPVPPPREHALGALRGLEREIPVPAPSTAEFYGRLVEIMRGFLAAAEGVAAFHMTSRQILESVGSRAVPGARRALGEVLNAADEVRFGAGLPDATAQVQHLAAAKDAVGTWSAAREGRR